MSKIRNINREEIPNGFESDLNNLDSDLFESVGDYMKGRLDLEEAMSDPSLAEMRESVDGMIEQYYKNKRKSENEQFIKGVLSEDISEVININEEVSPVKKDNKLNEITAEWVKDWHEKKQKSIRSDKNNKTAGSVLETDKTYVSQSHSERKNFSKTTLAKYISFAAAAVIGAFVIIKTLFPSSDPGKIFNAYYSPFQALSVVTRDLNSINGNFPAAVADYKKADYQNASVEFKAILDKDPTQESSAFLLGLSQLGLGNYKQAISLLSDVADKSGEYGKEARWYLGLSYLKISDEKRARACFEELSQTEGFYRERSEKILRRLR